MIDPLSLHACLGVQKERMEAEDMYVLSANGNVLSAPSAKPYPNKPPKCTDSADVFMKVSIDLCLSLSLSRIGIFIFLIFFLAFRIYFCMPVISYVTNFYHSVIVFSHPRLLNG